MTCVYLESVSKRNAVIVWRCVLIVKRTRFFFSSDTLRLNGWRIEQQSRGRCHDERYHIYRERQARPD